MDEPLLTRAQREVVEAIAEGWSYRRTADWLGVCESTVHSHVGHIADKLPNPDDIKPYQLVFLWASQKKWLKDASDAA